MPSELNTDTIADAMALRLADRAVLMPRLLTLDQAALYLGLTKDALKAKVRLGRVPTVDLDKKLRFDQQDLDQLIGRAHPIKGTAGGGGVITPPAVSDEESPAKQRNREEALCPSGKGA